MPRKAVRTVRATIALVALPLISTLLLTSCVSIQDASPSQRVLASGPPHPGKATIFVYRPSRFLAGGLVHTVFIDGRLLGSNASGTFLVTEIDPGHHIVTAGHDQHELNAQAGQTYYYEQTVCWAMYDPSNATGLQKVSASEGRGGVSQRKQAPNAF